MKKHINHVTVLGSGIMGSGIACMFANIGVQVLLIDMAPSELSDSEKAKGLSLNDPIVKNRIVNNNLRKAVQSKPALLYHPSFIDRISTGNLEDDLHKIKHTDWIFEVVVENLKIKKSIYENIEKYRIPGTYISSNTSGIPIHLMSEGRSDDFKKYFAGTHFFNPVRYLQLLEIIPTKETSKEVIDFYLMYGDKFLGKTTVLCKDTPGFIGNRIGVYSMSKIISLSDELDLTAEETDVLTGSILGRPQTGTFKLSDLVGLDTAANVTEGLKINCPEDTMIQNLKVPDFMKFLTEHKFLGNKSGKGFYFKEKDADGKDVRYTIDLRTLEYRILQKPKIDLIDTAKQAKDERDKLKILLSSESKYGNFYRKHFASLFAYVSLRIPEISDNLYSLDDAMKTGYAWKTGPFELWDQLGLKNGIDLIENEGFKVSSWVKEMQEKDIHHFYQVDSHGNTLYYDQNKQAFQPIPGQESFIILNNLRPTKTLWQNSGTAIEDLGDGIINIEFRSKMNSLGGEVLEGINKGIELAEKDFQGVVISNQGTNFSVGANLAMIFMLAIDQDWEELNMAIALFQQTTMRVRYSNIPVVVAPHGMALGGGCELTLHADKVVAAAETYIGLVEFGVGVIPGGGGSKEFARRASLNYLKDDVKTNRLRNAYMNIGTAKVSTSAYEAMDMGILIQGKDTIIVNKNRLISEAKKQAILLAERGYTKPYPEKFEVLGRNALGMFYVGSDQLVKGGYMSEHDQLIANKLAYVMTGGNLSEPSRVTEQYILDLEREAFLSLCGEKKTLERIQYMLQNGKPLRN
ncbi:3-hydroxyacyl-CoA dehydrogenase/enoyl-CoA hydratase family protein [Apibacter sp. HY039]|uniref:3-hydroxyacyl-CoA dehydrogenase/enoyl-CoA hydratase family protein n=1 Tax=Apibacter sp. HY039 TaxID=2501476 RepID=UPI000FEC139B|nr:3-hydroxyacyl-CoA dehydrogenase/enoyl-CoA hydratase family protein [Apibacter sp. HY039]